MLLLINFVPQLNIELSRRIQHLSLQHPVVLPFSQSQNVIIIYASHQASTLGTSRTYECWSQEKQLQLFALEVPLGVSSL